MNKEQGYAILDKLWVAVAVIGVITVFFNPALGFVGVLLADSIRHDVQIRKLQDKVNDEQ